MENEIWVVDLDHTLVRTDTGVEGVIKFLRVKPVRALLAILLFFKKGLGPFKEQVCKQAKINVALLPYRWKLIDLLKESKAKGHRLVLCTASHQITADAVAQHLQIFDDVIATRTQNVKGAAKAHAIRAFIGERPFLYWGDSEADFQVWKDCARVGVVNPNKEKVERLLENRIADQVLIFRDPPVPRNVFIRAIRLHQWSKNLLVFLPILGAHLLLDGEALLMGLLGAIAFSFVASGIYILNDLSDIESDRSHETKKNRPFANGDIAIEQGLILAALFLVGGFILCAVLPESFLLVLAGYFALTCLYSFWLKKYALLDVVLLALLYSCRVFGGGAAASVAISEWLFVFSFFFFFSLAFVKRYTELRNYANLPGRGYRPEDKQTVFTLGIGSGLISVLVFSLFIFAPSVAAQYPRSGYLGIGVPLLFFWISRIWFLAARGEMLEDPVVFALKDRVSYGIGLAFLIILLFAGGPFLRGD
ncbi:MAG: UbiA family prenyltransferase [Bdellovibrio sp.]|nr:UbiA family prenyltransferase [Bdellovibrio sp.]